MTGGLSSHMTLSSDICKHSMSHHSPNPDENNCVIVWFCDKGASTPPAIAATPVPALPPPIAVNTYPAVPAPPSGQSASETLYTNGVHQYQGDSLPTVSDSSDFWSTLWLKLEIYISATLCWDYLHLSSSVSLSFLGFFLFLCSYASCSSESCFGSSSTGLYWNAALHWWGIRVCTLSYIRTLSYIVGNLYRLNCWLW